MRRVREPLRAALPLFLALVLAGCSSSGGTAVTESGTTPSEQATTEPSPSSSPSGAGFSGIVMAELTDVQGSITLTAYSSSGTIMGTRTFTLPEDGGAMFRLQSGVEDIVTGQIVRQEFDRTFTRMAATLYNQSGGVPMHIGYLSEDGAFTDLTKSTAGYGGGQQMALFNPGTGRIWYKGVDSFGSVDPDNPSDARKESGVKFPLESNDYYHRYYFSPDGSWLMGLEMAQNTIFSLDGRKQVLCGDEYSSCGPENYRVGSVGKVTYETPSLHVQGAADLSFAQPLWFLGGQEKDSFLIVKKAQIYKMTISGKRMVAHPILPPSNQGVFRAVGSPDGKQVAFLASAGMNAALYTVPSDGSAAPRLVADVPANGNAHFLIDWTA
ncbi:hypothetical protein ABZ570_31545 [Micromonospora sp. NPDC007271]|uniref:hypothetical protein n=1 Tax=Micromonospora sp. NPDC007271 TaxID=3154587 RepID=UPI003403A7EC